MPAPEFILRSYGGGAEPAQLVNQIEASDLSFEINLTTGWVEEGTSNPLGTSGPFVVVIDRFTASVEKILCSSVNLTSGLVNVYDVGGFSGRGYDGTAAQAHVPGGSTSGVQTCWSAQEAKEANAAVVTLLGGSPANGDVLQIVGGSPTYAPNPSGLAGVPTGRIYQSTPLSMNYTGSPVVLTNFTNSFLLGGMTSVAASGELVVPVTGCYRINAVCQFSFPATVEVTSGTNNFIVSALVNGVEVSEDDWALTTDNTIPPNGQLIREPFTVKTSTLAQITNGQAITMSAYCGLDGLTNGATVAGATKTYLEAELVSA